ADIAQPLHRLGENGKCFQWGEDCQEAFEKLKARLMTAPGSKLVRVAPANSDAAREVQVVLPQALVPEVQRELHNVPTGGHLGVQKLQGKVKDRFYWPEWFKDVRAWVRECADCGSVKMHRGTPCTPLEQSLTSRPFERIAVDILGPLPETGLRNKYIMVVGDYFSKRTEAFPLPNQEAKTIARVLTEEWVCRFGMPWSLNSDQGRNFESKLFQELCGLLQIHKTRTTPYHPQSDGLVEKFNRTLLTILTFFVEDNQLNLDSLLPYVMLAYRSSIHASTSVTPYKVLFGGEIVLPVNVMLNLDKGEAFASCSSAKRGGLTPYLGSEDSGSWTRAVDSPAVLAS
uniref:Gypsy retrotransposon integrase-like protein 1 n=1 Tax=Nothobranchius furzeri TaxID=105023 RepID=A0A8C6NWY3_NOTFU